jgi:hypothetical protein
MFRYAEHSEFSCTLMLFDDDGYSWVPIVKQPKFRDILVRDVCRATTAAPTFFSPVDFTVSKYVEQQVPEEEPAEKEGTHKKPYAYTDAKADEEADADPDEGDDTQATFNMIDGGIAANNPVGFSSVGPIKNIYMQQLSQSGISSLVLSFISI